VIVVDASVWMSYLVRSDSNHRASDAWLSERLSGGRVVVAPILLLAEVGGAIARVMGRPDLGGAAVDRLLSVPNLRLVAIDHALGLRIARLAAERRLRGADACYIAVAAALEIPLVSWDNEQLDRAREIVQVATPDLYGQI
jgi:predicted nucleic acid-binding protein